MNLFVTILICAANPLVAYAIVKIVGLELLSPEYYVFDDPLVPFCAVMITVDYVSMVLLSRVRVSILTSQILFMMWCLICTHCIAFLAVSIANMIDSSFYIAKIDTFVIVFYPAIMMTLHASQLFFISVECGTRIVGNEHKR